ncbi:PC4 and SFRS1-interacting protein [Homalodisca vitripennis]|nr:PC4 and SFRS1-interacting protein [Homalodisca vitripennis]
MTSKYQVGDLVIAKLRGHPSWPAIIDGIENKGKSQIYNVVFYGSKERGKCRYSELSSYIEHKNKLLSVKKMSEDLKIAINEIEEEFKSKNKIKPSRKSQNNSFNMSKISNVEEIPSTPLMKKCTPTSFQDVTKSDAGVNTTQDIDLNYQLQALTDRCISLEKSLIEERSQLGKTNLLEERVNPGTNNCDLPNNVTSDFQKQILLQELNSAKSEILNLNSVIICLQNDYKGLEGEIQDLRNKTKGCMHCLPSLKVCTNTNTWMTPSKIGPHKTKSTSLSADSFKNRLLILADSHGKNLGHLVEQRSSVNAFSCVRPGARFGGVVEDFMDLSKDLTKEDSVLIIAGTNNMEAIGTECFLNEVQEFLTKSNNLNLILATLPMRHDQPNLNLDLKISKINREIEVIAAKNNCLVLPLHHLPRHLFTNHGLHLNKRGKLRVAEMIVKIITTTSRKSQSTLNSTCSPLLPKTSGITVVESDMRVVFGEVTDTKSTAFAHTISSDFQDPKHMSAGEEISDLIYNNLARQNPINGPTIYSLVTKSRYFGKPTLADYDAAFDQLQNDFKSSGLSTLICSAMGCVRDLIEPQHFITNIIKFHKVTGANVKIITYDQQARRSLWRGLAHDKFVETLKSLIASQLPAGDSRERVLMTGTNTSTPCPVSPIVCEPTSLHPV